MAKPKTRAEKLFSAAVLRRSFQLQDKQYQGGFKFVYEGVLRDLELTDEDVAAYLEAHREEVERAIGRKGTAASPERASAPRRGVAARAADPAAGPDDDGDEDG